MPLQIAVLEEVRPVAFAQCHARRETGSLQRLLVTRQPRLPRPLLGIAMILGLSEAHSRKRTDVQRPGGHRTDSRTKGTATPARSAATAGYPAFAPPLLPLLFDGKASRPQLHFK